MTIEGRLTIVLTPEKGGGYQVQIHSTRPLGVVKALIGNTPEQCLAIVPMLFNVCGQAQAYAAHGAIRQALGLATEPVADNARQLLVMLETVREHGWRILLDWPRFIGRQSEKQPFAAFLQLSQRIQPLMFKQGDAFRIDSQPVLQHSALALRIDELETLIDGLVFDGGLRRFIELETEAQLVDWMNQNASLPASLMTTLYRLGWPGIGQNSVGCLPELDPGNLSTHLLQQSGFSQAPSWFGRCYETGPLGRQQSHPLLVDLSARYRNGLLCRIVARLLELAAMPACLRRKQAQMEAAESQEVLYTDEQGSGLAQVQAARGLLIHRVRLSRGRVVQYQIVAPTEWNFHPDGIIAASLKQLRTADNDVLKQQADWLINTIDPCVHYQIEITPDGLK